MKKSKQTLYNKRLINLEKVINKELKSIEKEYDIDSWLEIDVDDMNPSEAFNRGYYRALFQILLNL